MAETTEGREVAMPAFNGVQSGCTYWKINQKEFCFVRSDKAQRFDTFQGVIENVSFKAGEYEGKETMDICLWFLTDGIKECVQVNAHTNVGNAVCKILAQAASGDTVEMQVWQYKIPPPDDLTPAQLLKWEKTACCVSGKVNGEKVKCGKAYSVAGMPVIPEPDEIKNGRKIELDFAPVIDAQVQHTKHLKRTEQGQQQQQQEQPMIMQYAEQRAQQRIDQGLPTQRFQDDDDIPF